MVTTCHHAEYGQRSCYNMCDKLSCLQKTVLPLCVSLSHTPASTRQPIHRCEPANQRFINARQLRIEFTKRHHCRFTPPGPLLVPTFLKPGLASKASRTAGPKAPRPDLRHPCADIATLQHHNIKMPLRHVSITMLCGRMQQSCNDAATATTQQHQPPPPPPPPPAATTTTTTTKVYEQTNERTNERLSDCE